MLPKNRGSSAITEKEYQKTVDYLKSRKNATNDWIWYLPTEKEQTDLREKFSIDAVVLLFLYLVMFFGMHRFISTMQSLKICCLG